MVNKNIGVTSYFSKLKEQVDGVTYISLMESNVENVSEIRDDLIAFGQVDEYCLEIAYKGTTFYWDFDSSGQLKGLFVEDYQKHKLNEFINKIDTKQLARELGIDSELYLYMKMDLNKKQIVNL